MIKRILNWIMWSVTALFLMAKAIDVPKLKWWHVVVMLVVSVLTSETVEESKKRKSKKKHPKT